MMYEEYEKKILKIRGVFEWIYKYRAIIISTVSLIMAGIIALLVTKGIIIDDKPCENAIVYGERLSYKSSAFMDVAKYEFSYSDRDEWFDEEPTNVGKYKMRAYNHGNFGIRYTGQIYYFEIKPKPIDLYIENTSFVYGDNIILNGNLRSGDKVSSFDIEYDEEYSLTCNAIPKNVKITNDLGEDVTYCYDINYEIRQVNIAKRTVVFKTYGATREYDGKDLSNDKVELVEGFLKEGDEVSFGTCISISDVSKVLNEREIKIFDSKGVDITNIFYNVVTEYEYLEIVKKKIEIKSNDLSKIYDGDKFNDSDYSYTITNGEILSSLGHKISINYLNKDLYKVCVNEVNDYIISIVDNEGKDASIYYDISKKYGSINIEKRDITITSNTDKKIYDGEVFYNNNFTFDKAELATSDEIIVCDYTSFSEVGEKENILTYDIINNKYGSDVTDCYNVNPISGTLLIEKRLIKITIENLTKVYDGTPLIGDKIIYDESDVANGENLIVKNPSQITDVGVIDNDVTIDIIGRDGLSTLNNYIVEYGDRTDRLQITHRPIKIQISSEQKLYDGEELKSTYEIIEGDLAKNQSIKVLKQTTIKHVDESPIVSEIDFDIVNVSNESVISNYDLKVQSGTLRIDKKDLIISTENESRTYDGKVQNVSVCYDVEGLINNDTLNNVVVSCKETDAGKYSYDVNIDNITITNNDGENVLNDYNIIIVNEGILTINKRRVTLKLIDKEKIYDATSLTSVEYEVISGSIVEGQHAEVVSNGSVINVIDSPMKNSIVSSKIIEDETLVDKTHNYIISHRRGNLTILPRPITVKTEDMIAVFDGTAHSNDVFKITSGDLVNGDVLEAEFPINGITNVWEQRENNASFKVKTSSGKDNTSNYDISVDFGNLIITPCPITIMTLSETHVYDGTVYEYDSTEYIIGKQTLPSFIFEGSLPDGFSLKGKVEVSGLLAGKYDAVFDVTEIISDKPVCNDIRNFEITNTNSSLIIKQRELVITSLGGTKYYDGTPFPNTKWISSGSLATGDVIVYEESEPIVDIGTHTNEIVVAGIFNADGVDVTSSYKIEYILGIVNIVSSTS